MFNWNKPNLNNPKIQLCTLSEIESKQLDALCREIESRTGLSCVVNRGRNVEIETKHVARCHDAIIMLVDDECTVSAVPVTSQPTSGRPTSELKHETEPLLSRNNMYEGLEVPDHILSYAKHTGLIQKISTDYGVVVREVEKKRHGSITVDIVFDEAKLLDACEELTAHVQRLIEVIVIKSQVIENDISEKSLKELCAEVAKKHQVYFQIRTASHVNAVGTKEMVSVALQDLMRLIEDETSRTQKSSASTSSKINQVEFETSSGIVVKVDKRNLVEEEVDAIVNPANVSLSHGGGAAKAIAAAAGKELVDECNEIIKTRGKLNVAEPVDTTAGKLSHYIKRVIHVAGPSKDSFHGN